MLDQIKLQKWNWLGHRLRRNNDSIDKQALQRTPRGDQGTPGVRNVDNRLQVQLEEDEGGSRRK